ncbi:hypothetical protein F2981_16340 [Sinorhizobium meliloti]|nr:hypothetical protein [Sinorhizobium meliloti]
MAQSISAYESAGTGHFRNRQRHTCSFDTDWVGHRTSSCRTSAATTCSLCDACCRGRYRRARYDLSDWPTIGRLNVSGGGTKTVGWQVLGLSGRFAENWSATLEYLHYDFGKVTPRRSDRTGRRVPALRKRIRFRCVRVGIRWRM